jgi:predicted TIM-barrel fold metal-dependent hydrolase
MDAAGIGSAVLVQATTAYGYDNSYVVESSRDDPRFAAVGTVDPLRPDAAERLARAVAEGGLSGVRLFTQGSTVPTQGEWFAAEETYPFWRKAGELGVPVCVQMRLGTATKQLEDVLDRFSEVTVLLDHLGYPAIAESPERAGAEVAALARHPRLHLKLTHRNLEPLQAVGAAAAGFLGPVVGAFGAGRIAWGSNCPAAEQPLDELVLLAREVLAILPEPARAEILAGTARRLYPKLARDTPAAAHSSSGTP